jgi:hypothetical protein
MPDSAERGTINDEAHFPHIETQRSCETKMVQKSVEPEKAKQARWGWQVLMVLVVALILAMIAWYAAETYTATTEPTPPAAQSQAG